MTEQAAPEAAAPTPQPSRSDDVLDVLNAAYAAMAKEGDETEETAPEASPDDTETVADKKKGDEKSPEEPPVEPEEQLKSTEAEIKEAVAAIEAEKKALAEQKARQVANFGKLQRRENQAKAREDAVAAKEAAHKDEAEKFQAERRVWLEDVRTLMHGDVTEKISVLKRLAPDLDVVDFVKAVNESTAGVGSAERQLQAKLDAIEKRLADEANERKTRAEAEAKARQEAEERAAFEKQIQEGDALVQHQLGQLVVNANAYKLPAIAELTELVGPQAVVNFMYQVGEDMVRRGYKIPYAETASRIAQEVTDWVTRNPKGIEWLEGLRRSKPSAPSPAAQTTATGSRTSTPGTSLSVAATSAPGPRRSDLPSAVDAITELKTMSSRDFALTHLPAGLVDQ